MYIDDLPRPIYNFERQQSLNLLDGTVTGDACTGDVLQSPWVRIDRDCVPHPPPKLDRVTRSWLVHVRDHVGCYAYRVPDELWEEAVTRAVLRKLLN